MTRVITKLELAALLWRLATLVESGLTIAQALNRVAEEVQSEALEDA